MMHIRVFGLFRGALTLSLVSLLGLGACKHGTQPPSEAANAAGSGQGAIDADSCPMRLEGVSVTYEDVADGAAMHFSTSKDNLGALRARVAGMSERQNSPRPHYGVGHVAHSARTDEVEGGVKLILTPASPDELDELRAHIRTHVTQLQEAGCPMMMRGPGMGRGGPQRRGPRMGMQPPPSAASGGDAPPSATDEAPLEGAENDAQQD